MPPDPLDRVTQEHLLKLGKALWNWELCEDCNKKGACSSPECATQLNGQLSTYFSYYKNLVNIYERGNQDNNRPALRSHEDLFDLIQVIKFNPSLNRIELTKVAFPDKPGETPFSIAEQERAVNLAAKIIAMVSCTSSVQSLLLLEHGLRHAPWQADTSFSQFITRTFPASDSLTPYSGVIPPNIKQALSAQSLKKIAGFRLVPTNDLSSHLKMDRRDRVVQIFHHCGFLRENLRVTKDYGTSLSVAESIRMGCLPRQLALETLDTIQEILFPLDDAKSCALLSSLISSSSFDPECQEIPSTLHRGPDEGEIKYFYFGHRLEELYEEVSEPGPQSYVGKWVNRRKGTRHVMLATLTGVVIAIVLGILTLGVSGLQAWLGYQQWQHPKK